MATSQRKGASSTTKQQRRHLSNKDSKVSQQHLKQEREDESIFKIVYSATTQLITPPPSPKSHTLVSQSFEANDRVLSAKRQGQLKTLLSEYTALKKEGLLFTDHTYNLIFDAYAALRRDGTPLTTMLKSKYQILILKFIGRFVYQIFFFPKCMMKCLAHTFNPVAPPILSSYVPYVSAMLKFKSWLLC